MNATIDTFDRVYHIMLATKISEDIATARWINEGIDVVSRLGGKDGKDSNVTLESERTFLRVASAIHRRMHSDKPYQPVTIHRHYPKKELGDALAVLNFDPARLSEMIAAGESDARKHDCEAAGCVIA